MFLNSKAETALPLDTAGVWAEEKKPQAESKEMPGIKLLVVLATLVMLLAVAGSVWVYVAGWQRLHALAAQVGDKPVGSPAQNISQVLEQSNRWALELALTAVASGAGLFAVAVCGGQWLRRRLMVHHKEIMEAGDLRSQRLLGQLADAKVSEEEARSAQTDVEARLTNISQRHIGLEKELEQRRQAEKSLVEQTQQLERSKDVLEMHVQARTQELQKLQRRNELILNSAAEGICGFDVQGHATFVNPAASKATGWKVEELIGKTEEAIFFPDKARGLKGGPDWLKNSQGQVLPEQLFCRKDGSSFPAEYVRTPIKENEKLVGWVTMFKDISERQRLEAVLNRKMDELARSNRELEEFAQVASHDLQEPLRKIQSFSARLQGETVQLEEGRDYLARMQNAAERMQSLINGLLNFSRVIGSPEAFAPVDLGQVTAEVLVDLEHRIEQASAQVQVGKLPTLQADPTQMRQLMQNLIGNALKFQAPGAVPIIKVDAQLITRDQISDDAVLPNPSPTAKPDDQFCVLTVQDNGIGFEEQYLNQIFTVFQRLHGPSDYEGTGVGLAVCRRITDRHGGLITAQSRPGEGAIFIVILPLQQPKTDGGK